MKRNQQKRPEVVPERRVNGLKRDDKPRLRKRPAWMRDAELERSINAAVQDGDYSAER
ncbi:MAG: hypothetical protein ACRDM2_04325 [Gaiellaceae bacterium]